MCFMWLTLLFLFSTSSEGSPYQGIACFTRANLRGYCRPLKECATAHIDFQNGILPTLCSYYDWKTNPVVCCPLKSSRIKAYNTKPTSEPLPKETEFPGKISKIKCSEFKSLVCPIRPSLRSEKGTIFSEPLVRGVKTEENEFPHMAAIGYGKLKNILWQCGGSLISENFVLTAAHCLFNHNMGFARWVRLGSERLQDDLRDRIGEDEDGQTHPIIRRIPHPEYRPPSKYYDLALLELGSALGNSSLLTVSELIHPACLQTEENIPVSKGIATGWGTTSFDENKLSPDLLKVDLSIINSSICSDLYKAEISSTQWLSRGIDSSLVCAGELNGEKDTCLGDSGGPLQYITEDSCVHKLIAVTSFGKVCGLKNSPSVYTRVSYFIPWIESIVWPNG